MKLTITITSPAGRKQDIQVDHRQRLKTTLRVLSENIPGLETLQEAEEIRIKSSGRRVDRECTYEEAGIYTGMELLVMKDPSGSQRLPEALA